MNSRPVANLTRTRQSLLESIADALDARIVLLLLIDNDDAHTNLSASYVHVADPELRTLFENSPQRTLSSRDTEVPAAMLEAQAKAFMEDIKWPPSFEAASFSYRILTTDWSPFEQNPRFGSERNIGVLVFEGDETLASHIAHEERLATSISIGRYQRFVSTVLRTQRNLAEQQGDLDETIMSVTRLLGHELGATSFLYRNKNRSPQWTEYAIAATENPSTGRGKAPGRRRDNLKGPANSALSNGIIAKRTQDNRTLEITLSEQSFEISNLAFNRMSNLSSLLKAARSQTVEICLQSKVVEGYLQDRFSETDHRIAEVVYKNLQNFAELKSSDESYSKVFTILHDPSLSPGGTAAAFLAVLKRFSALIDNVHVISIGLLEDEINTSCESANPNWAIDASYVYRLKKKYLEKFYHGNKEPDYAHMAVGMDAADDHFYLEIHTPSEFGNSRIYVISVKENLIPQATFHSISNLFREIFTRMKMDDFLQARSNYLQEARHAVVHQFSAGLHGIDDIKTKWDRGLRNREFWLNLLDDPVFPESLDLANWSLNQAQLILENSRFVTKDINPKSISRKPFNVLEVITDCQRVLRIEARRKSLKMVQQVRGAAPPVTNGDEVLMRIAIMNLIDNAIKYSLNRGEVRWELIYKPDRYEFRVTNAGDPLAQERFKLLRQVGVRGKQRDHLNLRPGTGLGLPVTQRILHAHWPSAMLLLDSKTHRKELGGAINTFYFEMPYLTGQANVSET